jgi:large repetitive protein
MNISRRLYILIFLSFSSLVAVCQNPGWTVNPGSFNNSMTVTTVANVSCVELANSNHKIGAFVNGICRGVVNTNTIANGRNMGFLVIYSNIAAGELVKFKIYDSVLDLIFDSADSLYFTNNAIIGTVGAPYVVSTNHAPTNILSSGNQVYENMPVLTFVSSLTTVDPDIYDTHTYSLAAGVQNNNEFTISGNSLLTNTIFNYELATQKVISVTTNDGNGCTYTKLFNISIRDTNDVPTDILLNNLTIEENKPTGTLVGALTTIDEDTWDAHTYSLVTGTGSTHNSYFSIVGNQLRTNAVLDFENISVYFIRLRTTDLANTFFEKTYTILAIDVNDPPTNILLSNDSITENLPAGSLIGILAEVDQDAIDSHVFTFTNNASVNNGLFQISGTQLLSAASFDFETQNPLTVEIRVTDSGNETFVKQFIIIIKDTNDVPTNISLSFNMIQENFPIGTLIGNFSTADQDTWDIHAYSLVSGTGDVDNSSFSILNNQLLSAAMFDHEVQDTFSIRLRSTDLAGTFFEKTFMIIATDTNDIPTNIFISVDSIAENQPSGTFVAHLTTEDDDVWDAHIYTLVAGAGDTHNLYFYIVSDTLRTDSILDFENINTYSIRIRTTDLYGETFEKEFTIYAIDLNDAPTDILLSNDFITENLPIASLIGILSEVDQDATDSHVFTLTNNPTINNGFFQISGNQLLSAVEFDFETQNTYTAEIIVTDSGNETFVKQFTISIRDTNDVPTDISLSYNMISEKLSAGTLLGDFTTSDQDTLDAHTYTLAAGTGDADNSSFTISGNQLFSSEVFDFEEKSTYKIRVRTTDLAGTFYEKSFQITIKDENDSPTDIIIEQLWVTEDNDANFLISDIITIDQDSWDNHTYALVAGEGDTDNSQFTIINNELFINFKTNYEVQKSYSFRIRSTDDAGEFIEKDFVLTVKDIDGNNIPLYSANYISPNGDGKNDYWIIPNVEIYKNFSLHIFNEQGLTVYQRNEGYDNSFDGRFNGNPLPSGIYYYVLRNSNNKIFKGVINIVN